MSSPWVCAPSDQCVKFSIVSCQILSGGRDQGGMDQGGMSLGEYNYVAYMMYIVNCLVTTEEGVTNIHYVAYMMYIVNCSRGGCYYISGWGGAEVRAKYSGVAPPDDLRHLIFEIHCC